MNNRILRERARAAGKQWFQPQGPCQKGHDAPRSVATGKCQACTRASGKRFFSKQQPGPNAGHIKRAKAARDEAIANGDIMYKSGKDCPHGHVNPWRYVIAYNCVECNAETQKRINAEKRKNRKPKPRGRPKKIIKQAPTTNKIQITEEERKDESFAEMVRKVYERNQNW